MAKRKGKSKSKTGPKSKVSPIPVISSPANREPAEPDLLNTEAILAAAFNAAIQPVILRACRLCEAKDGPFLNIFSAEKVLAKKIEDLLPFVIREEDELPHKICFRCSAKVEELHDFVQKCIRSQENLEKTLGKSGFRVSKTTSRKTWEEKLNKSNISNADICDAVIKKAMEGIQGIQPLASEELDKKHNELRKSINNIKPAMKDAETETDIETEKTIDIVDLESITDLDEEISNKISDKTVDKIRITRSTSELPLDKVAIPPSKKLKQQHSKGKRNATNVEPEIKTTKKADNKTESTELKPSSDKASVEESKPPFDIKAYVITVKINGVGNLFQCKLCNRNFMQEVTVLSHACAKTGVPKVDFTKSIVQSEPPKNPPTNIKYITQQNVSSRLEAALTSNVKPKSRPCPASKKKSVIETVINKHEKSSAPAQSEFKQISRSDNNVEETSTIPGLKSRYKLLPGPNNTFTLFEQKHKENGKNNEKAHNNEEIINLDDDISDDVPQSILPNFDPKDQPYPVGLFQTMPRPTKAPPVAFTTPAMKKQSYTVVQTGNPSKLLISAKTTLNETDADKDVSGSKKGKKRKAAANLNETQENMSKQPFSVTLEDSTHPKQSNEGFFTFINVDPLLQPSYVLPTSNTAHNVQNTSLTSTASGSKTAYNCHICSLSFNRDKKLQAHIQSHFKDLDKDEEILPSSKKQRKRTRNS